MSEARKALVLVAGSRMVALPLDGVRETMRPLAIEPVAGAPAFVRGVSVIRGQAVPVVDVRRLFAAVVSGQIERLVTVAVGGRTVALGVDGVVGVRDLPAEQLDELPPLLRQAAGDAVEALGALDGQLLVLLHAARLLSEDVWRALEARP